MTTTTIAERVAKGAAFLDECEPGWDQRIDLDKLNLKKECRCILGQLNSDLTSNWDHIMSKYGLARTFENRSEQPTDADLGFNTSDIWLQEAEERAEYAGLTAEWRRVIETRRPAS